MTDPQAEAVAEMLRKELPCCCEALGLEAVGHAISCPVTARRRIEGAIRAAASAERRGKMIDQLKNAAGYWYLASPYSKYRLGLHAAFQHVCEAAGELLKRGVIAYSPIAHTHPIGLYARIDSLDVDFWLKADKPLMDGAYGLLVLQMPGWKDSYGIGVEVEEFQRAQKPVHWLKWPLEF